MVLQTVINACFLSDVAVKVSEEKEIDHNQEIYPIIPELV